MTIIVPSSLLFLRHPDIQSDVWATPPEKTYSSISELIEDLGEWDEAEVQRRLDNFQSAGTLTDGLAKRDSPGFWLTAEA